MILGLRTRDFGREHVHVKTCASTQDLAVEWARRGAGHGAVITCDEQTQGRGRLGRAWQSGGLSFSVLLSRGIAPSKAPPLSIVAGVALTMTLRSLGIQAQLKWPNDLWCAERKVGGILTTLETWPHTAVIVGVGLNLGFDPTVSDASLVGRAAALPALPPGEVLSMALQHLEAAFDAYIAGKPIQTDADALLALKGKKVRVDTPHGIVEGQVMRIHHDYSLVLHTALGERTIDVGDVWPVERMSP